jgi:molybdopterin converting factor small subunit
MLIVFERSVVPLRRLQPRCSIVLEEGTSIRELLRRYVDIAKEEPYLLPVVNGEGKRLDYVLRDGDRLGLFRLSAGG